MTTIRLRFHPSSVAGKEGTLYYQVIHFRKVVMINTDYRIFPHEWDEEHSAIRSTDYVENDEERKAVLRLYQLRVNWDIGRMLEVIDKKERTTGNCVMEDLQKALRDIPRCTSVFC